MRGKHKTWKSRDEINIDWSRSSRSSSSSTDSNNNNKSSKSLNNIYQNNSPIPIHHQQGGGSNHYNNNNHNNNSIPQYSKDTFKSRQSTSCGNLSSFGGGGKSSGPRRVQTFGRSNSSPSTTYDFNTVSRDYFPKDTISSTTGNQLRKGSLGRLEHALKHNDDDDDDDDSIHTFGMGSVLVGCFDTYDQKRHLN
ncbi:hypothetical protein DFA_04451 [Cavenderia fasciculata]|uniref:Uncharacterized protein n=1 Tax=Cavenderia fasciculata TaxID=261658 RepID=F4PPM0_CACFS|nr:uncharacterized protein DFA_04451 [Cavenderia fasciculata]EGG22333.1 hypothetical protein DFA_04451 [Cavenderia fasciculata]|eukprot:XP_004360184.1 hypothetical protein DFA_04451 [Cavenderia fasciculata]